MSKLQRIRAPNRTNTLRQKAEHKTETKKKRNDFIFEKLFM